MPTARVFGWENQGGISRHISILRTMMNSAGFSSEVFEIPTRRLAARQRAVLNSFLPRRPEVDLNVFVESIAPEYLHRARRNVLIPMQEWFWPGDFRLIPLLDLVVCHSNHAADIFSHRGAEVVSIGFTSVDRFRKTSDESRSGLLHIAGRSHFKGTAMLLKVWGGHPEWPTLTVVHREGIVPVSGLPNVTHLMGHIADDELRALQNESWLHLQPSEAEGFGHCLCEGMSTGALVVTTDAPPMNELVNTSRGVLIPWTQRTPMNSGSRFIASEEAMSEVLDEIIRGGQSAYVSQMANARSFFERNDRRAHDEFARIFRAL